MVDGGTYKEILKKIGGIIKGAKAGAKAGDKKAGNKDKKARTRRTGTHVENPVENP